VFSQSTRRIEHRWNRFVRPGLCEDDGSTGRSGVRIPLEPEDPHRPDGALPAAAAGRIAYSSQYHIRYLRMTNVSVFSAERENKRSPRALYFVRC
jgi:hypothetical protein